MSATERDHLRLQGVHPTLVAAILTILDELPMFVVMGMRTADQQRKLWLQGRRTPGPIVTYKDGYINKSNHQPHADGYGHAVDCAFLGAFPFAETHDWETYGSKVEAAGLQWGGRFIGLVDKPHAELVEKEPS